MTESQIYQEITKEGLLDAMRRFRHEGWRLCQISVTSGQDFDVLYSLERASDLTHLRLRLAEGQWLDSVSGVFSYAFLYENEIKDLFGIDIHGMNVDFGGQLYQTSASAPFRAAVPQEKGEDQPHG